MEKDIESYLRKAGNGSRRPCVEIGVSRIYRVFRIGLSFSPQAAASASRS